MWDHPRVFHPCASASFCGYSPAHMLQQLFWLLVLSVPVACVAWTVTHEEVFKEPREFCMKRSQACRRLMERKFFYLFTCEYCFSHYVTAFFIWFTHFK